MPTTRTRLPIRLAAGSGRTFGVDDLACAAATYLGCWEDEGLDVTWTPVHGGVAAVQAVLDGTVDVGYGGLGPALRFRAQGAPVRIVVSMARALAQQVVAQPRLARPMDLRGASWAIDGRGALSHHMARLVVRALGIAESEIDWQVVGPPPERIARLLEGSIDVSLIRVEEATALTRDPANELHTLLGFAELKKLVPVQPHGVLSTTEAYEAEHADELHRLTRGMIRASRALADDFSAFRKVYDRSVTVSLPDDAVRAIWRQEVEAGGFAVNGEMTARHWQAQLDSLREIEPDLRPLGQEEVLAELFVTAALEELGTDPGPDMPEGA